MVKQLNEEQYLSTMGNKMNNVTESAEPLVNIWNYAKQLLKNNLISEDGFSKKYVEAVYENTERTYQHILLFTNQKNFYAVIVVDIVHKTILGHYILDLNEKYGLIYINLFITSSCLDVNSKFVEISNPQVVEKVNSYFLG